MPIVTGRSTDARRRASRSATARSGSDAISARPPHDARITKPPTVPSRRSATSPVSGEANARRIADRSSPVARRSRSAIASRSPAAYGRTVPSSGAAAGVRGRFQDVPRMNREPQPLVDRPALVRRDQDLRHAALPLELVDDRPRQGRAQPGPPAILRDEDRADPADAPVDRRDAGSHDAAVGLGHEREAGRVGDRPLEEDRPVAPVAVEDHLRGLRDVGGEHRPDPGGGGRLGHPLTIPSRPDRGLGYHRAVATLSRADVEHVAYLARLGLTDDELALPRGPAQPHPRPVREAGRARHRRHPADGPDDRAREHPPRRRRARVAAGRGRPAQRLGADGGSSSCRRSSAASRRRGRPP